MTAAAFLWLALPVLAAEQYPQPAQQPPAAAAPAAPASTATVAASSGTAPAPEPAAPPAPPPPKPVNPIQVRVHGEAREWEPVSVAVGGEAEKASTHFSRRLKRHVSKKTQGAASGEGGDASASVESDKPVVTYRGESSRATAAARIYPVKDDHLLVVSVYPKSLARSRKHLEARFFVVEGFLEEVKVAAVTVAPGSGLDLEKEDSMSLKKKGVAFREDFPGSGSLRISAISTRKGGLNAGTVSQAGFADKELELTSFGWSARLR